MAGSKKFKFSPFKRGSKKKEDVQSSVASDRAPKPTHPKAAQAPKMAAVLPSVVGMNKKTVSSNQQRGAPKRKAKVIKLKPSWLARRRFFVKLLDQAFDLVDQDDSGTIDEKELYSGLLLIHLKLGLYAGPAACKPVDKEHVLSVFRNMDVDDSGTLDREEFREVMMILFSNVLLRVMVQWCMTLLIVPLVAQSILDGVKFLVQYILGVVTKLDEHSVVFDAIEVFIETMAQKIINLMPGSLILVARQGKWLLDCIPESVWNTIPLTLLSCILGMLAVPWLLYRIDNIFHKAADKKKEDKVAVSISK